MIGQIIHKTNHLPYLVSKHDGGGYRRAANSLPEYAAQRWDNVLCHLNYTRRDLVDSPAMLRLVLTDISQIKLA